MIRVKIAPAFKEDIGKKTIRIPKKVRRALGVELGEKVLASSTSGNVMLTAIIADPTEVGQNVAGIDAQTRRTLNVELGDTITLSKPTELQRSKIKAQSSTLKAQSSTLKAQRSRSRSQSQSPPSTFWLFCYGSNHPEQLAERLGHPVRQTFAAYLPDYRLKFLGFSQNWQGGVAGLIRELGSETCGYVAPVTDDDLSNMDRFEGVAGGYYFRAILPVMKADDSGEQFEQVPAVVYLPGQRRLNAEHHPPSDAYLAAVEKTIFTFWEEDECRDYLNEAIEEVS